MGKKFDKEKKLQEEFAASRPLNKESEDLFKIAFRNYLNLIGIADKKAGLLIQVNSILAGAIIGFVTKKIGEIHLLVIPAGATLIVACITIFYSIKASKPLNKVFFVGLAFIIITFIIIMLANMHG